MQRRIRGADRPLTVPCRLPRNGLDHKRGDRRVCPTGYALHVPMPELFAVQYPHRIRAPRWKQYGAPALGQASNVFYTAWGMFNWFVCDGRDRCFSGEKHPGAAPLKGVCWAFGEKRGKQGGPLSGPYRGPAAGVVSGARALSFHLPCPKRAG
jgi:hypothetical protein